MLLGQFREADQVQQGHPVEMAAFDSVVEALLQYIYGEEPQIELDDSLELLRLAEAYNFPELAAAIEGGLSAALDSAPVATALKVLRQTQGLPELQDSCEDKLAANFEVCIGPNGLADFPELSSGQLGRILRRADLKVSREEQVVEGLFKWFNGSKERSNCLGALLHTVDFQSIASSNLARLGQLSLSIAMGPILHDLQREIGEALQTHKKRSAAVTPDDFRPKRECFQHWSPDLGACVQTPQKVLPYTYSMCCHGGSIYYATCKPNHPSSILRWKPGDTESQVVAGRGARVNGVNDLGSFCVACVSPEGVMFVADGRNRRLLSFENGSGNVVLTDVDVRFMFCSPNGAVCVLTQEGDAVEKLVGATLQPRISSEHLPAELRFKAFDLFVTKDEVIYLSDHDNSRVLRLNPGEAEPVVVGEAPNKESSELEGLFVTEDEKVYVADSGQRKVWAFHPGDAAWAEVLVCPKGCPVEVLVQGRSLYVSILDSASGIYEYLLPPELQLG